MSMCQARTTGEIKAVAFTLAILLTLVLVFLFVFGLLMEFLGHPSVRCLIAWHKNGGSGFVGSVQQQNVEATQIGQTAELMTGTHLSDDKLSLNTGEPVPVDGASKIGYNAETRAVLEWDTIQQMGTRAICYLLHDYSTGARPWVENEKLYCFILLGIGALEAYGRHLMAIPGSNSTYAGVLMAFRDNMDEELFLQIRLLVELSTFTSVLSNLSIASLRARWTGKKPAEKASSSQSENARQRIMALLTILAIGNLVAKVLLQVKLIHAGLPHPLLFPWRTIVGNNGRGRLGYRSKVQRRQRQLLMSMALTWATPLVSAALTINTGFRILSGVTSSASAVAVLPLRMLEGIPSWALIISYGVWFATFVAYLCLHLGIISAQQQRKRNLYVFWVILFAIHLIVAISQSTGIEDGVTIFGPLVLVVSAFLWSLIYGAGNEGAVIPPALAFV